MKTTIYCGSQTLIVIYYSKQRGIGFLDFTDIDTAKKALEKLNNYKFDITHKGLYVEFSNNTSRSEEKISYKKNLTSTLKAPSIPTGPQKLLSMEKHAVPIAAELG